MNNPNSFLIDNIDKVHSTEMGLIRVQNNLDLNVRNIVEWCKTKILDKGCIIRKNRKNWYATIDNCIITINANNFTIITAHKVKKQIVR